MVIWGPFLRSLAVNTNGYMKVSGLWLGISLHADPRGALPRHLKQVSRCAFGLGWDLLFWFYENFVAVFLCETIQTNIYFGRITIFSAILYLQAGWSFGFNLTEFDFRPLKVHPTQKPSPLPSPSHFAYPLSIPRSLCFTTPREEGSSARHSMIVKISLPGWFHRYFWPTVPVLVYGTLFQSRQHQPKWWQNESRYPIAFPANNFHEIYLYDFLKMICFRPS